MATYLTPRQTPAPWSAIHLVQHAQSLIRIQHVFHATRLSSWLILSVCLALLQHIQMELFVWIALVTA